MMVRILDNFLYKIKTNLKNQWKTVKKKPCFFNETYLRERLLPKDRLMDRPIDSMKYKWLRVK